MIIYSAEKLKSGSLSALPLTLWFWKSLLFSKLSFFNFVQDGFQSFFQFWACMFLPPLVLREVTFPYNVPIFYSYYRIQNDLPKDVLKRLLFVNLACLDKIYGNLVNYSCMRFPIYFRSGDIGNIRES